MGPGEAETGKSRASFGGHRGKSGYFQDRRDASAGEIETAGLINVVGPEGEGREDAGTISAGA